MSQSVLTLKDELAGQLHGTNIDDVHYPLGVFYRAARQVMLDCDPFETKRLAPLTTPIYQGVFSYAAPADLDMNGIIDLRPQTNRNKSDLVDQRFSATFDRLKETDTITVEYVNGVKVIRIAKQLNAPVRFGNFGSTTGWSVGNDATNLTKDTQYFTYAGASLNFDLDGNTTNGYIENSTVSSTDLSTHENVSRLFLDVYMPNSTLVTSVTLRWGSSAANYFEVTSTSPFDQSSFVDGWNTVDFDWNGAAETGTVDNSAIDYLRVVVIYDGTADTDYRVDNLRSILGQIYDVQYYSNYLFLDASTGAMKLQPTSDDDLVNLEPQSMNLFLAKVTEFSAQQAQQQGANVDVKYFANEYKNSLKQYKSLYPSEKNKPKSFYYRMRQSTYGKR